MTMKRCLVLGIFLVLMMGILSLAPATTGLAADKMELKLGNVLPHGNIITEEAKLMAKRVAEKTNGMVVINIYPLTLGGEREILEGMQLGTIDMGQIGGGVMGAFAPEAGIFSLPYIFKGWDHLQRVLTSDATKRLNEAYLKKTGLRILGWMEQGFRQTITVKKPITSLEDMKGLKIRLMEDKVLIRTFELFGARPTVIPWGEAYTALQTGLVEGMESTPPAIVSMKFAEVTNYLTLTDHQHAAVAVLIRESLWKKLDSATQKSIQDSVDEMLKLNYSECQRTNDIEIMKLVRTHKVTYNPDLGPFQKAVLPLHDEYGKETETTDLIKQIQAVK